MVIKSQIYVLLDLVDRYWNGSKSLHKNQKFLNAAKQILSENGPSERFESNYQLKILQEENRRLNYQLSHKKSEAELESYKGLISEIVIRLNFIFVLAFFFKINFKRKI